MCNCITTITKKVKREGKTIFQKEPLTVELKEVTFPFENNVLSMKTYSTFNVQLEGKKRLQSFKMMHSFCPFCGQAYDTSKEADQAETPKE